jgi:transposase-like protein
MEAAGPVRTLTVVGDAVGVEPDEEAHLFKMSPASAEQVTIQIRSMLERAWEYIAIAYQGRAFLALGYQTWDEYVEDRLSDLRLTVPREERAQAVAALSDANMSLRAIAKVLGVSPATAYRDLAGSKPGPDGAGDTGPIGVRGRDGKQYPRRKKTAEVECALCGENHPAGTQECPWDLFAQGRGPRPGSQDPDDPPLPLPGPSGGDDLPHEQPSGATVVQLVPATDLGEAVMRAVCIVDELAVLPELVDEIEAAERSPRSVASRISVQQGVRELIEHLRVQAELISDVVVRLEQVAQV